MKLKQKHNYKIKRMYTFKMPRPCGCGLTSNPDGNCDGSHANK